MSRTLRPGRIVAPIASMLLASTPVLAQKLGQAPDDGISFMRVFAALLLCLAVVVGAAFFLRNRAGLSQLVPLLVKRNSRLRLVESVRLSQHVTLCIVQCDGEDVLLEVSQQGAGMLRALPPRSASEHRA
jgi:flagellar biogenesis protein FliO